MSFATINMNYRKAIEKANQLEEIANSIKNMADRQLGMSLQEVSNCWKGDSANEFIRKGSGLQQQIYNTARQLKNTAATIRNIAERTRRAELRAEELAKQRIYGDSSGGHY